MKAVSFHDHIRLIYLIAKQFRQYSPPLNCSPIHQLLMDSLSYFCRFYTQDDHKIQIAFKIKMPLAEELPPLCPEYLAQDIQPLVNYLQLLKNQEVGTLFKPSTEYHFAFQTSQNELLPYRIFLPAGYAPVHKLPLVVGLHGAGYDENSLVKEFEINGQNQFFVQAEKYQCLVASIYVGNRLPFYKKQAQNEQNVCDFLQHLRNILPIDNQRIFLLGHSMGCRGTWHLATTYPTDIQGIAFVAGATSTSNISTFKKFETPLFYAYGGKDNVVKPQIAESFLEGLKSKTSNLQTKRYEEATHESILPMSVGDIFTFLMQQKQK